MSNYRIAWCRRWMARAHELEPLERADAAQRHPAVLRSRQENVC